MALPHVLSAMRELVLDGLELPSEQAARAEFFAAHFPNLTEHERTDLALIPPEKFKIYTGTVFSGEAGVFRRHFRLTAKLLKASWKQAHRERFDSTRFVKLLHKHRPWKSYLTLDWCRSLLAFIRSDCPEILHLVPEIYEVALFETLTLEISRVDDGNFEAKSSRRLCDLTSLTVNDLLELNFAVPRCARFQKFEWNVLEFYETHGEKLRATPQSAYLVGARSRTLDTTWKSLGESPWKYLQSIERDKLTQLEGLASAFA